MPTQTDSGDYVIFTDLEEGNSFAIMNTVKGFLRQIHGEESPEIIENYLSKAMSGDYGNLQKVSMEMCPIITFGLSSDYDVKARKY